MTGRVFIRMYQIPDTYGVSVDTVRRWEKDGKLKVHRPSPSISTVRVEELEKVIGGKSKPEKD